MRAGEDVEKKEADASGTTPPALLSLRDSLASLLARPRCERCRIISKTGWFRDNVSDPSYLLSVAPSRG
jgi:hypothetical protein